MYGKQSHQVIKKREKGERIMVFKNINYVDVGARGGINKRWDKVSNVNIIGFEPDKKECKRLNEECDGVFYPIALSDHKGMLNFYLNIYPQMSSVYILDILGLEKYVRDRKKSKLKALQVECDKLDNIVEKAGFLKLDVEGGELSVLKGATRLLSESIIGIDIEAWFVPFFIDQPLFSDIDNFLRKYGFVLYDMRPAFYKHKTDCDSRGEIVRGYFLYIKQDAIGSAFYKQIIDVYKLYKKQNIIQMIKNLLIDIRRSI